jgi:hypothetical protein
MTGFEISVKDKIIYASVDKGLIYIFITYYKGTDICIGGFNKFEHTTEYIKWYIGDIDDGDNIIIRVLDVQQNSEPIESMTRDKDTNDLYREYLCLDQELRKEGMI